MASFREARFKIKDELFKFRDYSRDKVRVLLSIDTEVSPKGANERKDGDHAISWVREFGKVIRRYQSFGESDFLRTANHQALSLLNRLDKIGGRQHGVV